MAFEPKLEKKVEKFLNLKDFDKRHMFGGTGYMLNGNMCVGIHRGKLILRLLLSDAEWLLANKTAKPFDITGRPMKGWVMVPFDDIHSDDQLLELVELAIDYVHSLPPK